MSQRPVERHKRSLALKLITHLDLSIFQKANLSKELKVSVLHPHVSSVSVWELLHENHSSDNLSQRVHDLIYDMASYIYNLKLGV